MQRAQRRGACLGQKFWWRRDVGAPSSVAPLATDASEEYAEMTIDEIVSGKVAHPYRLRHFNTGCAGFYLKNMFTNLTP